MVTATTKATAMVVAGILVIAAVKLASGLGSLGLVMDIVRTAMEAEVTTDLAQTVDTMAAETTATTANGKVVNAMVTVSTRIVVAAPLMMA